MNTPTARSARPASSSAVTAITATILGGTNLFGGRGSRGRFGDRGDGGRFRGRLCGRGYGCRRFGTFSRDRGRSRRRGGFRLADFRAARCRGGRGSAVFLRRADGKVERLLKDSLIEQVVVL